MTPKKSAEIIGVPLDFGANMRGANLGPYAIRIAGLHDKLAKMNYEIHDAGNIQVPIRETLKKPSEKYLEEIFSICKELHSITAQALNNDHIPIVLGGDHSIAMGSISAANNYAKNKGSELGLIWIDAHADLNIPETSPTGNIHGMPLATLLGKGHSQLVGLSQNHFLKPENVALIGIRDIDGLEKEICRNSGIRYYTMREIDERGMHKIMKEVIQNLEKNCNHMYISLDMDGIDPAYAPGVSTPVTGGLSYRETHLILEMIADTQKLIGMDLVELNPMTDIQHKSAYLAVELIQSALGKSIV